MIRKKCFMVIGLVWLIWGMSAAFAAEADPCVLRVKPSEAVYETGQIPDVDSGDVYRTVSDAVQAARSGDTIMLEEDIEVEAPGAKNIGVNIDGKTISFDLNGHLYSDEQNTENIIKVSKTGVLCIKDSSETQSGCIRSSLQKQMIFNDGKLTIENGNFIGTQQKNTYLTSAVFFNQGDLEIRNGYFQTEAIYVVFNQNPYGMPQTVIYDGSFFSNQEFLAYAATGSVFVEGGRFKSNKKNELRGKDRTRTKGGLFYHDVSDFVSKDFECRKNTDEATAQEYPYRVVPISECVVATTSLLCDEQGNIVDSDRKIGLIQGGGIVDKETVVTVTAAEMSGFHFKQWYCWNDAIQNWDALSSENDPSLVYMVDHDVSLAAGYHPDEGQRFYLDVEGSDYSISGTLSGDGHYSTSQRFECLPGAEIRLTAGDPDLFKYWQNQAEKILSRQSVYTFCLYHDAVIKETGKEEFQDQKTIQFFDGYDQLIKWVTITPETMESKLFPTVNPSKMGYRFDRWRVKDSDPEIVVNQNNIRNILDQSEDEILPLEPVYVLESTEGHTVTIVYPDGTEDVTSYTHIRSGDTVIVSPDAARIPEGKTFAYWTDRDGIILSYESEYFIRVAEDMVLYPHFLYESIASKPSIAWTAMQTSEELYEDQTIHKFKMTVTYSVPEGYSVLENGILFSPNEADALTLENIAAIHSQKASDPARNGVYTVNVRAAKGVSINFRGYLIVSDGSRRYVIYTSEAMMPR